MQKIALTLAILLSILLTGCNSGRGDSSQKQSKVNATIEPDDFLTFVNNPPEIDSVAYAEKYYQTVDPNNERTTLEDWKSVNGFDPATAVHATFRDTKDLGYGRDMYAWQNNDNTYIYVDNYVVELEPGDATSYGPMNLDAAIAQDRDFQIGTNAIEYSPDSTDPNGNRIAKFFIFKPRNDSGDQPRITSADLDGRGVKHMPTMCVACHGATMYPLTAARDFNPISLKSPKMHMLEQNTFQFSSLAGFTEAAQEGNIKEINRMVYDTLQDAGMRTDDINDQANWDSAFAMQLINDAYGGKIEDEDDDTPFVADVIPPGWAQNLSRPNGVETLYRRVVSPHCIGCHSLRGTQVAEVSGIPNATNFSSYEKFISYKDQIIEYVYRRDTMPRSLINYSQFWDNPGDLPTLLASYLPGFDVFDANGKIVPPGKAVAIPGADRTVVSPAFLDATASKYTTSYAWRIISSTDPINPMRDVVANLDNPSSPAPVLSTVEDAVVVLELTTSNANGDSDPAEVIITVDNSLTPPPSELTFVDNIMSSDGTAGVFGSNNANCISCHNSTYDPDPDPDIIKFVPVYFDKDDYPGNENDLYRNVLDRVDLDDPENSLLLRKPTSLQHGGGIQLDLNTLEDKNYYNTLLNWIRNGAPCGSSDIYCPES